MGDHMTIMRRAATMLLAFAGTGFALAAHAAELPKFADLQTGWTTIAPGGETACATGTPYSFHVKPGEGADAEKLLIFLNGGGACWTGDHCGIETEPTPYFASADIPENTPQDRTGIFDLDNAANPVANWTQVFAPYCTGDVHLGNRDVTYTNAAGTEVTIRHRGRKNAEAVLAWVYANIEKPERILVAGSSAGAIATPLYAADVADHYPDTDIIAYADGAGGYRDATISGLIENWGFWEDAPDWTDGIGRETATFEDIDRAAMAHAPRIRFAEYDSAYDAVQEMFLRLLGNEERLYPLLQKNRDELAEANPSFRAYTARGTEHTLLRYDRFYTYEEEGVTTRDWLANLIAGEEVESVTCGEPEVCETTLE